MGVAINIMFTLFFLAAWIFAATKSLLVIPAGAVVYFVALFFSIKEPRFHEYLARAITRTPPLKSRDQWGNTNSYEPW
jgi:type IV secretory pathway VirB3-like protein